MQHFVRRRRENGMRSLMQDVRYALRQLRKAPGFASIAVIVTALGIGANIAVFTLISGILLRPLPYNRSDRIATIELSGPMQYYSLSYANMLQLRDATGSRMQIGASLCCNVLASVVGPGGRVQVEQQEVTAGLPSMLGMRLIAGRYFRNDENDPGRNRVVLIGEDVWRKLYKSDAHIVGQTLTVKGQPYTIVGVMPAGIAIPYDAPMQVWSPAPLTFGNMSSMSGKGSVWGQLYARLPEGMTIAQLTEQLDRAQASISKQVPDGDVPAHIKVTSYQKSITERSRKPLLLLYAVVFAVWVLACLNVTSLVLARAISRTREQAVRSALGASRARLLQQTIVESLLLSFLGASLGLLVGQIAIKLLWRQIQHNLPLTAAIHFDWRVAACLAALTLLTAALIGIFPALKAAGRSVQSDLQGATATASGSQNRTRDALVIVQLSFTVVLLAGAGLFLRTINALRQVPLGFTQQNVLTGGIILNGTSNSEGASKGQTNIIATSYEPLLGRLRVIPGVRVAALSSVLPLRSEMTVSVSTSIDHGKDLTADGRVASPGLVDALGIPMMLGRFFTEEDTATSPPVAVVNQAFVDKFMSGQDPIGHAVSMGKGRFSEIRIVGVVADMKQFSVTGPTKPEIYFCLAQTDPGSALYGIVTAFMQVAIRAAIPANSLRAQFDKALHEVAPDAVITDVKTIHEAAEDSFGAQTLIARLLETFAGLALIIASIGLYGLLSFSVAQRTREIGIRIALGSPQANILALVIRHAMILVSIGLGVGGVLAWFAVKFASSYIYGVRAHDALTFVAVAFVLIVSCLFATWLPSRRAVAIDPMKALRTE